jgi:hypothetical protein
MKRDRHHVFGLVVVERFQDARKDGGFFNLEYFNLLSDRFRGFDF